MSLRIGVRTFKIMKSFEEKVEGIIKAVNEVAEMQKARPGLVQKDVKVRTKSGKIITQRRWVRPDEAAKGKTKKAPENGKEKKGKFSAGDRVMGTDFFGRERTGEIIEVWPQHGRVTIKDDTGGESQLPTKTLKKTGSSTNGKTAPAAGGGTKLGIRAPKNGPGSEGKPKEGQKENSDLSVGETITGTDINGNEVSGTVTAVGKDGVTVDSKHRILHGQIKQGEEPKEQSLKYVKPEEFTAGEWKQQWDDPKATPNEAGFEYILDSFGKEGEEIADEIRKTEEKLKGIIETKFKHRISGEGESARYTEEREKLHGRIMQELLHPDKIRAALPPLGEKPTFMILGGRGGSGKSWFENNIYDPSKFVVLNNDDIKEKLPEYEGWNAREVHEESSDILEQMLSFCVRNGLNVVLDGTMKTASSAIGKVYRMKGAGYRTEAHYMHLPPQEAAKRAIYRFKNGGPKGPSGEPPEPFKGRYVPVDYILGSTSNENTFDLVKDVVDNWSFRDNNKKKNRTDPPTIISEGKKS